MKVLVTGGAGFIGRHLVAALAVAGDEVVVLDNLRRGERASVEDRSARFVSGDVRDQTVVADAASGVAIIYHLAARVKQLPGAKVNLRVVPARPVEVTRFVADVGRMKTLLRIQPPADPLHELPAIWDGL